MFDRNAGFIDPKTAQPKLAGATVAIAGTGGDGGELALTLARLGLGHFILADPEKFEKENINRQAGAYTSTLGQNKAEVIAGIIKDINPNATVEVLTNGVTEDNIEKFVERADLVADETEFTQHEIGAMIARAARRRNLQVFMGLNVGFGCLVTSFNPQGLTFEEYLGLSPTAPLAELAKVEVPLEKWVAVLPNYLEAATIRAVASAEIAAPSVAPGVTICAGMMATEMVDYLIGRQSPIEAPESLWFDAVMRTCRRITDREAEYEAWLEGLSKPKSAA